MTGDDCYQARVLFDSITIVPAPRGRSVDLEIEGRLNAMIALTMGRPFGEPVM